MKPVETLTMQLYAKYGLEEMRKPGGPRFDRSDIFSNAYLRAMWLLDDRGFAEDDDSCDDELGYELFIALLAELADEDNPVAEALRCIRDYFLPERAPGFVPRACEHPIE